MNLALQVSIFIYDFYQRHSYLLKVKDFFLQKKIVAAVYQLQSALRVGSAIKDLNR